jgi:hypothetical protein
LKIILNQLNKKLFGIIYWSASHSKEGFTMSNKQQGKPAEQSLVQSEIILKSKIQALDVTISHLIRYKPYEYGESVDPASMKWVLMDLNNKKSQLEAKCLLVRDKLQVQNLCSTAQKDL